MAPQLSHADIEELLGAYALDAVDADERATVEAHLLECPRCRSEVAEHREAATLLAFSGETAPPAVWSKIAAGLDEAPPFELTPPVPIRGRRAIPRPLLGAMAAAAVIVALLGAQVIRQNHRIDQLAAVSAHRGLDEAAATAVVTSGARTVHLQSNDGAQRVDAVVLPSGQGYLIQSRLPRLGADQTYQLWGVIGAQTISLGVIGDAPTVTPFKAVGNLTALAITAEHSGGAVAPTKAPIVQGFV